MALSNFLSKLNWRLMMVHFVACWFIYHALWQLGYLYDYNYMEKITHNYYNAKNNYMGFDAHRMSMISYHAAMISLAGLFISFLISLLLSIRHKWYWLNSIIVLVIAVLSHYLDKQYYDYVRPVLQAPGRLFKSDWAHILTNGSIMLAIGLTLFFWKRIIRFIDGKKIDAAETLVSQS